MDQNKLFKMLEDTSVEGYLKYEEGIHTRQLNAIQSRLEYILLNKERLSEELETWGIDLNYVLSELLRKSSSDSNLLRVLSTLVSLGKNKGVKVKTKIPWNEDGEYYMGIYAGRNIEDILKEDPGYVIRFVLFKGRSCSKEDQARLKREVNTW